MLYVIGMAIIALVLSYLGVSRLYRWTEQRQILDVPNERSSHARPTPRGGGLAIVGVTLLGFIIAAWHYPVWPWFALLAYGIGTGLIAAIGWLDDLYSLPNRWRFMAHSLAAVLALLGFGYWHTVTVPLLGQLHWGWLGLPVTFFWIVGLTSAYNFMDGIDGIAGGQAVVAGLGWAVLAWQANLPLIGSLGVLLAFSNLGFLGHNWPPARIFMGDVGSTFLGYSFAVLALVASRSNPIYASVGVLLVGPFVFDAAFTFIYRLRARENVFAPHRSHLYQRLMLAGHGHQSVTLIYIGIAMVSACLALLWSIQTRGLDPLMWPALAALSIALWLYVIQQEHRQAPREKQKLQ